MKEQEYSSTARTKQTMLTSSFLNKIQQQNREAAPKKYLSGKILRNILRKYKVSVYVGRTNNVDKAVKQQKNCCLSRVDKPNNNFVFTVFKAN